MNVSELVNSLKKLHIKEGPLPLEIRKEKLKRLRDLIKERESAILSSLKMDLGKSDFEGYVTESGFILDELRHTLKKIKKWVQPINVGTPLPLFPGRSKIYPGPYGVVLIISPWNYPFQLSLSPLIGAISAGNRVVLKPSEYVPETNRVLKQIIEDVFSPSEVFIVEGNADETILLLKQSFDYIFFTGSTAVGRLVMKQAAENLTPVTLELGGKSPCIIDESASLDLAAKRCTWGKFMNAGQTCVAPDYVLIPRHLQGPFIEKIRHYLNEFYSDVKNSSDYPRIINHKHYDRLLNLINPDKVVIGGEFDRDQKFISPTVMRDVTLEDKIMEGEIFGPLLPIIPYDDLEEALQLILTQPKPLALYLFSTKKKIKEKVLSRISFGGGCINDTIIHLANPNLPFGGVGESGIGSYHGKKTFDTFSHYKSVYEQSNLLDPPLRYPPYKGKLPWLKLFLR